MSNHRTITISRRRFMDLAVGSAVVVSAALLSRTVRAAALPHLNPQDAAAQALGYTLDTNKVPSAKYPNHQPAQACGSCNFYKGAAGEQWGPCPLFPGKEVHVSGWCAAYTPKA